VVRVHNGIEERFFANNFNFFHYFFCRQILSIKQIFVAAGVFKFNAVPILHIHASIGNSPCDIFIEADGDAWRSGNGYAIYIHSRRMQLQLIPNGRHAQAKVRIVAKYRRAGCRFCGCHSPVVTSKIWVGLLKRAWDKCF
jgi:hypothetical protein